MSRRRALPWLSAVEVAVVLAVSAVTMVPGVSPDTTRTLVFMPGSVAPPKIFCVWGRGPRAVAYNDSMDTHTAERDVVIERVADQTTTTTTGGQQ